MRISINPVLDIESNRWLACETYEYYGPMDLFRGAATAAKNQLSTTNAIGAEEQQKANALEGQLLPGYTSLMDTGYLNPEEEAAATTSEMGATAAPFETAKFEAANRAAATRNASDLTAQQDQLALEEGQAAEQTAAQLQQQKMANQESGMYGIGQLQQTNTGEAESMYGMGPSTINAWSNAQNNNPWLNFGTKLVGAAGAAAA